ncbi:leucine-rich repeat protein kinase family protein isoform X2 [Wolffia australiana]
MVFGESASISVPGELRKQYTTVRYFPADNRKYCYTFQVLNRARYLVRATFLYGNFDNSNVYPKFDISLGATTWTAIVISDANTIETEELILLAGSPTISVCLSNATTGRPFISTLELRQFNGSLYYTEYETKFFLGVSARINFGAESNASVRYPDDSFDRIWQSDSLKKANYLVDVADGTEKISTKMPIFVNTGERPPQKVMQTAVVGQSGSLTYRLNLKGFPAAGWAVSYFAEIEDLAPDETRKFRLFLPGPENPQSTKVIVNVQENAQGKYRLYEPGYTNISFPFVFPFAFRKTNDSTRGPILNALEINRYVRISDGSKDAVAMGSFLSLYGTADWAQEGGDPCLPASWSWVQCSSSSSPYVVSIVLSRKNISGIIPLELTQLTGLVELWLDGNALTGSIPDFSGCINLKIIHLEDNKLTGDLPISLGKLPNLKELYLQNNMLSGVVPQGILNRNIILNISGNANLREETHKSKSLTIFLAVLGSFLLLVSLFACSLLVFKNKRKKKNELSIEVASSVGPPSRKLMSYFSGVSPQKTNCFSLTELEEATGKFDRVIGSGGYGVVYYGKLQDGQEIAVKVLINDSYQGTREFSNEVSLLSRIHHRNLVPFLGYCQEGGKNILVYEFMHNGTLKDHLFGCFSAEQSLSWIKRLEIAEEAGRGIEYLHTGCTPGVIHRDLKSSNILLDKNMRAKVSDFGLSKLAVDGSSHVSSVVRGTVGYLDPEYYVSQQLTLKSDVYSFGVLLLELISGQQAISNERFGPNYCNIVPWAKAHIESGNIQGIIDPALGDRFNLQSVWKVAEQAMMCVHQHGMARPTMPKILKELREAIAIERGVESGPDDDDDLDASSSSAHLPGPSLFPSFGDDVSLPSAR